MKFEIHSFKAAGPITFGMTRDVVRRTLGGKWVSFKRGPKAAVPNDDFEALGVIVNYKMPGVVEAVEFVSPADPVYEGMSLLRKNFKAIRKFLQERDPNVTVDRDGLESRRLGIGIYAPDAVDDPSQIPESVIAFAQGYYD